MDELSFSHNGESIRCCTAADGKHLDIYVQDDVFTNALTIFPDDTQHDIREMVVAWRERTMPGLTQRSSKAEFPL